MFAVGFIPVAYIFKQSTLDKFVAGAAAIAASQSKVDEDASEDC